MAKFREIVRDSNVRPIFWGKNQPGMQANSEMENKASAKQLWEDAKHNALVLHEHLEKTGVHKQIANRILEPFFPMTTILSSTGKGLENFFSQRCHPDAQPEIRHLAEGMRIAYNASEPKELKANEWHLPFLLEEENDFQEYKKLTLSVARCARVSYMNHQKQISIMDDMFLYDKLLTSKPPHLSPFEHVAIPKDGNWGNFQGFKQYRQYVEEVV
jgi:thymidylate synthase ThyX